MKCQQFKKPLAVVVGMFLIAFLTMNLGPSEGRVGVPAPGDYQ